MHLLSRRLTLALLASTALPLSAAPAFARNTAAPEDQADRDAALKRVRDAALAAAKARDFKRLSPYLDPAIQLDFGGGAGANLLRRRLAERPGLWEELVWVLGHGGRFDQQRKLFTAPYTFSTDTRGIDPFEAGILIGPAIVRAAARANATPLATLRDTVVRVIDWRHSETTPSPFYRRTDWIEIVLPDKRRGWVEAKHARSAVDYRAGFEKKRGQWRMTFFLAGD